MVSENVINDINNMVDEIEDQIDLTQDSLDAIRDITLDTFGIRLTEHSRYIDTMTGDLAYE